MIDLRTIKYICTYCMLLIVYINTFSSHNHRLQAMLARVVTLCLYSFINIYSLCSDQRSSEAGSPKSLYQRVTKVNFHKKFNKKNERIDTNKKYSFSEQTKIYWRPSIWLFKIDTENNWQLKTSNFDIVLWLFEDYTVSYYYVNSVDMYTVRNTDCIWTTLRVKLLRYSRQNILLSHTLPHSFR